MRARSNHTRVISDVARQGAAVQRAAVQSTSIATVGYDEEQQLLEVVFRDGRVYHFLEVPPERVLSLLRAESKGRFFNAEIRDEFGFRSVGRRWG
jgi:hypothetical protein